MTSNKHGVAWIINNKVFEIEDKNAPSTWHGTDRDEDNLVKTLFFLGYRVKIYRNLKRKETIELFSRIDELLLESSKKAKIRAAYFPMAKKAGLSVQIARQSRYSS